MIGRGCSTKDKVFYRECETHSYGDSVEKMCFCSFMLCNSAPPSRGATPTMLMVGGPAGLPGAAALMVILLK